MLEHLPKVSEDQIKEQFKILNQAIVEGQVQQWLNTELGSLHETNPVLFHYIVERANKLAVGAMMVGDPNSISVSLALEYVLLLNILNIGIGSGIGLKEFGGMMKGWFGDTLKNNLNDIGKDDNDKPPPQEA